LPRPNNLSRGHHAALPYNELPAFMDELRQRSGVAARALEFLTLTATRTSEALNAAWAEFDFEAGIWTIPATRMKARVEHRVPLSQRALEILSALKGDQEDGEKYVFAGQRVGSPLSNMALLMMLRRMKREDITAHGFRSAFSTGRVRLARSAGNCAKPRWRIWSRIRPSAPIAAATHWKSGAR
jgi:integrase